MFFLYLSLRLRLFKLPVQREKSKKADHIVSGIQLTFSHQTNLEERAAAPTPGINAVVLSRALERKFTGHYCC